MRDSKSLYLKTIIPVTIGIAVFLWLFFKDFNIKDWEKITWSSHIIFYFLVALIAVCGREFGLMWRFNVLSDGRLNWHSCMRVTIMCEFTSAVTPTSAGGSALSMIFMNKEGLSAGRATTITLTTFLLDEAFFVLMCPVIFLAVGESRLFGFDPGNIESGIKIAYWIVWGGIVCVTFMLFWCILIRPNWSRNLLLKLFSLGKLKRWKEKINTLTEEMVSTSHEIKQKNFQWWAKASSATVLSWISRFLVVNALFYAFAPYASQLVVFVRQIVVWTLLTVSPTPGGSGVSEWLFTTYYGDLISDVSIALFIALCWRLISYYIYLVLGVCFLPSWLKQSKLRKQ